ncbi:MAG: DUF4298 domain-containing protein, partial [Lachnospiraceae bacterium]|nr:DUF4298 domain-containing protein [Lachnospiraceae bacterium]
SATKTVLSIAVGIAYDEGNIELDRAFLDYIPVNKRMLLTQKQSDMFAGISIRRLLTMSVTGFPFRPEGDNWLEFSLNCRIEEPDRVEFDYSNIPAYLMCIVLTNALGCDLGNFIEKRVFVPMDITEFEYARSPEGYFYGASGMRLSVHDLSKFGLLLNNKGIYNGNRIVSEEYVSMATSVQQMNREGGYGFYIWKYRGGFSINGKWKQKCYVVPQSGIIVTFLSHIEDDSQDLLHSMEEHILGIGARETEAFDRIATMEVLFEKACSDSGTPEELVQLETYYTSPDWRSDYELDEAGLLPAYLKRGVLSEDGVYNLMESIHEYGK